MIKCPQCKNTSEFQVVTTSLKISKKTYDKDGDLVHNEQIKSSFIDAWFCVECGALINDFEDDNKPKSVVENNAKSEKRRIPRKRKKKGARENEESLSKTKQHDRSVKPSEKQLKYLNDLASKLGFSNEEMEGFKELSKKEVSEKLTELYKECKRKK